MDKELAGQPVWLWLVGAGIVVVGYLWFKSRQSAQQAPAQGAGGGRGRSSSTSTFRETIRDWQSPSKTHKRAA